MPPRAFESAQKIINSINSYSSTAKGVTVSLGVESIRCRGVGLASWERACVEHGNEGNNQRRRGNDDCVGVLSILLLGVAGSNESDASPYDVSSLDL